MKKYLEHIDLKDNWLHGRLHNITNDIESNFYKFFKILNAYINNILDYASRIYISIYPCKAIELLNEHEIELGIPDSVIFRNTSNATNNYFTYTYPIIFGNTIGENDTSNATRQNDIIVKKYLMQDNSILGFKRIASQYNHSISIEETQEVVQVGNTRDGVSSNGDKLQCCKFPYGFPIFFGNEDDKGKYNFTQINSSGDNVKSTVTITVYGNPSSIILSKLRAIYNYMRIIGIDLKVIGDTGANIYNPANYKICK